MVQWINMVEFTYTQHMVGRSEPWKKTGSMILFIYSSERDRNIEATHTHKKKERQEVTIGGSLAWAGLHKNEVTGDRESFLSWSLMTLELSLSGVFELYILCSCSELLIPLTFPFPVSNPVSACELPWSRETGKVCVSDVPGLFWCDCGDLRPPSGPGLCISTFNCFFLLFILLLSQTLVLSAKFPQGQIHVILGSIVLKSFLFGKVYLESLFFLISKCNYK